MFELGYGLFEMLNAVLMRFVSFGGTIIADPCIIGPDGVPYGACF